MLPGFTSWLPWLAWFFVVLFSLRATYDLGVFVFACVVLSLGCVQISNYLTFGPTQVEAMDDTEFGGPLPITKFMCYFDTHLHYLKNDKSFKPSFMFIDHQPDLVCKIASIEPDSRMYLLGVSTDSLSDWVNRVQTQLNPVLTQRWKLDKSGDSDQQPTGQTVVFPFGFAMRSWVLRRCR